MENGKQQQLSGCSGRPAARRFANQEYHEKKPKNI
jgi:hypothetical protein